MSTSSEVVQETWPDGHELRRDRLQWIVRHPQGCQNAKRGNLTWQYAKETFFQEEAGMRIELGRCGVRQHE